MRRLSLLLLVAGLGGCVVMPPTTSLAPGVTAREDLSHRYVAIIGPKLRRAPPFLGVDSTNYEVLRSWLDRTTGKAHHQLYVSDSYAGERRGWDAAHDDTGAALPFVAISHDQITCDPGCSWQEDFAANIADAQLREATNGLAVIFTARSGAETRIELSQTQIAAQLAAIDAERRRLATSRSG